MITHAIAELDIQLLDWMQANLRCEILDKLAILISFFGNGGWFFIVLVILLLFQKKSRIWGAKLATSISLGFVFGNLLIKNMAKRTRPYDLYPGIELLVDKLKDYSFPSGHTLVAFEFFLVICLSPVKMPYKILAGIFAFSMAFSRLYLYVHFPSDVVVGAILGSLFGVMGGRIIDMILEEKNSKKIER